MRQAEDSTSDSHAATLARSLDAFDLSLTGATREAGEMLRALEVERWEQWWPGAHAHPYLVVFNGLAAARWLLMAGDTVAAVQLLGALETCPSMACVVGLVVSGPISIEQARIAEASGRTKRAELYYLTFLQSYDMPVEAHRQLMDEANAALARLSGSREQHDQ